MTEHELSAVPREARPFQGQRAGVVTRLVASAVDVPLVALALVAAYVGVAGVRFLIDPRGFHWPNPSFISFLGAMGVLLVFYLTVAWAIGGRTFGNMLMGLRVLRAGGQPIGWFLASARAVAYVVLPIGLLWSAVDRRSRSVQDLVLWTAVVYDWRPRSGGIRRESSHV